MPDPEITIADLSRIYVVMPDERGRSININTARMSDRQFREFIVGKADQFGVRILVPMGRIGYETRVRLINYLIRSGVKIYMVPVGTPAPDE